MQLKLRTFKNEFIITGFHSTQDTIFVEFLLYLHILRKLFKSSSLTFNNPFRPSFNLTKVIQGISFWQQSTSVENYCNCSLSSVRLTFSLSIWEQYTFKLIVSLYSWSRLMWSLWARPKVITKTEWNINRLFLLSSLLINGTRAMWSH